MNVDSLYQEQILALARLARSKQRLEAPSHSGKASNPVCGDRVVVDIDTDSGGLITGMGARVDGCALCEAATGLMIQELAGSKLDDTKTLHEAIAQWLADQRQEEVVNGQQSFTPVKAFPARHRCITLPFEALAKATSVD